MSHVVYNMSIGHMLWHSYVKLNDSIFMTISDFFANYFVKCMIISNEIIQFTEAYGTETN